SIKIWFFNSPTVIESPTNKSIVSLPIFSFILANTLISISFPPHSDDICGNRQSIFRRLPKFLFSRSGQSLLTVLLHTRSPGSCLYGAANSLQSPLRYRKSQACRYGGRWL